MKSIPIAGIKDFLKKNEPRIALLAGFLLVGAISFEAGLLHGREAQSGQIVIQKAPETDQNVPGAVLGAQTDKSAPGPETASGTASGASSASAVSATTGCAYVGSKSSNKYYPPTCQWAKRIKPENLVCFKTEQEALAQGRVAGKGCK